MIRNYLLVSIRHLKNNKGFTLINILGLSVGMASAILIMLWVIDEVSYNRFNEKYDTLFQVMENQTYQNKTFTFAANPGQLAQAMKAELPDVRNTTRCDWGDRWVFSLGDKNIYEDGFLSDPSLFEMFSFRLLHGDEKKLLPDENSIVITKKMALKFFDEENAVGKYLKVNNDKEMLVTAVFQDPPLNSSVRFEWIASFKIFEKNNPWWTAWNSNGMRVFVELKPDADYLKVNDKLHDFIYKKDKDAIAKPFLHPMKDWRLRSNFKEGKADGGRIEFVKLFSIIALLLILIACINFMNLATARSEQRMREVGVRKVMGAERFSLIKQFMGESMFMSFIALVIACIIITFSLPFFNVLVDKQLSITLASPFHWLLLLLTGLLCGIAAGSYPSLYLSSFNPTSIFRGRKGKASGAVMVRKGLVITQFVISIVFIVSTVVIYLQIQHVKERQLGYDKENLVYIRQEGLMNKHFDAIRQDLLSTGMITHVAASSQTLLNQGSNTGGLSWDGKDPSKEVLITVENGTPGLIAAAGMKLIAGRDFYADGKQDSMNIIINESLARLMQKKEVVGQIIRNDDAAYRIVGVVSDFLYNNFYTEPAPYILFCDPSQTTQMLLRLKDNISASTAITAIEKVYRKNNPGYPFEYKFVDDEFDKLFKSEMLVAKLSRLFAILTIVISCLGLFGLAAFTAERRTKEIGIRKVLGASVVNVISLLSKDFLRLVCISILIATPIGWLIMNRWLQDYAYRIDVQWWIFVTAGMLALAITLLTVSFQAIKAAVANPVRSLRTE
jgi:putative ABC transport system permease protein